MRREQRRSDKLEMERLFGCCRVLPPTITTKSRCRRRTTNWEFPRSIKTRSVNHPGIHSINSLIHYLPAHPSHRTTPNLLSCFLLTSFSFHLYPSHSFFPSLFNDSISSSTTFHSTQTSVLQEARVFNESPISPRKCRILLTKVVYLLYTGSTFSSHEATQLFFGATKLFQHKDVSFNEGRDWRWNESDNQQAARAGSREGARKQVAGCCWFGSELKSGI